MPRISAEWSGLILRPADPMPEADNRQWREDRYGFLRWLVLPQDGWREWWDRIYVDPELKARLRAYAEFALRHRADFSPVGLPLHGIALLYGPPGTGKSSLVRGLAQVVAEDFASEGQQVIFAEVDPHALPSQMLGESQRNMVNLLEKSLPELAAKGAPVIVAVDEVDSLVTNRALATGGRDPVDVMRATEAALGGIDYLASMAKNVLILATSNFSEALDEAMLDRLDLVMEVGVPDAETVAEILHDTLAELPRAALSDEEVLEAATSLEGQSGRTVRKLVLEALVTRSAGPDEPFTVTDLDSVIKRHREVRS